MGYRPKYVCYCPFYEGEYIKGICCSGIENAVKSVQEFSSEEEKYKFIRTHCVNECPDNCMFFVAQASNYED